MGSTRAAIAALALVGGGFAAVVPGELEPVSPPLGGYMDFFGEDVDVDLDSGTIVVGAPGEGGPRGGAWVIEWDGAERVFTRLVPPSVASGARVGSAVAIEGDLIAVGATFDDTVASDGGAAYVFRRIGGVWEFEAALVPEGLLRKDYFGDEVDIDGGRIVVGATSFEGSEDPGRVFLFSNVDGAWVHEVIAAPDGLPGDWFGRAVHLEGELLVVGATGVDGSGTDQGAVYLFRQIDGVWTFEQRIDPLQPLDYDYFGVNVHSDGVRVAVAAAGNFDHATSLGRVHLLTPTPDGWRQDIAYPGNETYANLGTSVVLDGDLIYVGALGAYNFARQKGQVLVLQESGRTWELIDVLIGPTPHVTETGFGWSAAGDRSALVIGAPGYRSNGENSGEVYTWVGPRCSGMDATVLGTPGEDFLTSTSAVDVIVAGSGNDVITGLGADDVVCTGPGRDLVDGATPAYSDLSTDDWVITAAGGVVVGAFRIS